MDSIEDFIPRHLEPTLKEILNEFSIEINNLVDFGSILMSWDMDKKAYQDDHLPATLFLRNFIEQVDAISILISACSIEPCKILLRTALENLLYLEYLLQNDTYNRSMAFLVWNNIINNKNIERLDPLSLEYKKIEVIFSKDKFMNTEKPPTLDNARSLLDIGNQILNTPKYQPTKLEYDRTKQKLKGNMAWYSLFSGPKNIKDLAESLNHFILYDGFFRNYSAATHGTDILQGKLTGSDNENLGIIQIRDPKNAKMIMQNCYNFCMMVYSNFVKFRIPEKQKEYNEWFLKIRKDHLNNMTKIPT